MFMISLLFLYCVFLFVSGAAEKWGSENKNYDNKSNKYTMYFKSLTNICSRRFIRYYLLSKINKNWM